MPKNFILLLGVIIAVVLPVLLLQFVDQTDKPQLTDEGVMPVVKEVPKSILPPLKERVGQLLAIGHWREIPVEVTSARVHDLSVGSVIIMEVPEQEAELTNWTAAWQDNASVPLMISIDQEGGIVSRLRGANHNQIAQPDINDTDTAYAVASERAFELTKLGINVNFAPVVDSSVVPESFMYNRVFRNGDDIASLADAMIQGYQDNVIVAVPKHYPGHPDTADDSHITLPLLDLSVDEYHKHTQQFVDLAEAGNTEMLMTAHVLVPALDPNFPATLSPIVLHDLRERVGYQGLIITDDLAMQAVSDRWTHEEAAVTALQAGADMIMIAAEPEHASNTVEAIITAVETGVLPEARINEAYERVQLIKQTLK